MIKGNVTNKEKLLAHCILGKEPIIKSVVVKFKGERHGFTEEEIQTLKVSSYPSEEYFEEALQRINCDPIKYLEPNSVTIDIDSMGYSVTINEIKAEEIKDLCLITFFIVDSKLFTLNITKF